MADSRSLQLSSDSHYGGLIGASVQMRRLYTLLARLENSGAPVMIAGETGVGKELVARAIHDRSSRADKPYVIIDCSNMQPELIRSEMFGHVKGAFTGADRDREGAFEAASGGTVFLDEIGELPTDLQPHLLRVIESGQVQRVGDNKVRDVDVRVLAATNRNLADEVENGSFRQDLFFRLAVITLEVRPLRERADDIPLLANHMAKQVSDGKVSKLPPSVISLMVQYEWPGNVRELRNAVHRLLSLGTLGIGKEPSLQDQDAIWSEQDAPASESAPTPAPRIDADMAFKDAREHAIANFEKAYLEDLVATADGNISVAARRAGIDRKYLRDLLKKHGLYRERS